MTAQTTWLAIVLVCAASAALGQGAMKPSGRFALTHLSLHWCKPHDKLAPELAKEGIIVPYDGIRMPL